MTHRSNAQFVAGVQNSSRFVWRALLFCVFVFVCLLPPCVECAAVRSPGPQPLHHIILIHHSWYLYLSLSPCVECATVRSPVSPPVHHIILFHLSWSLYLSLSLCVECVTVRIARASASTSYYPRPSLLVSLSLVIPLCGVCNSTHCQGLRLYIILSLSITLGLCIPPVWSVQQ